MATKKTKVVVNSNGKNIDHTVEAAANGKAPLKIKVQKGAKYLLKGDDGFAPENVTLTRMGNDLHITLEGESSPSLVLEGYYAQSEPVGLYGVAEDGQLYAYARTDAAGDIYALAEGQSAPVALGGDSYGPGAQYLAGTEAGNDDFGGFIPLLALGGLAALGIGVIAAATGSSGDPEISLPVVVPPDVQPPGKPGHDRLNAHDDVGAKQGPIRDGDSTDDARPTFSGSGTPGNTIHIHDGGTLLGSALVGEDGQWTFTPPKDMDEREHSITITESDPDGREGPPSDPLVFEVDLTAPVKPGWNGQGLGDVIDNVGTVTGSVPPGGATDDQRPEFTGKGEPGHVINVFDDGKLLGSVEVDNNGNWTFTPPSNLIEGDHSITITETDAAGNESVPSDPFEFEVDLTAPVRPEVGGAIDDVGEITGEVAPGGVTDDRQPELHGKGEPGGTIVIEDNGTEIGTVEVDEDGNWSFIPPEALEEGDHSIVIVERDPAGNESLPSNPFEFEVDITPPDASKLAITGVQDDVGTIKGNIAPGGTTDDSHPVISGTGTAGDTIIVSVKDSTTGTGEREIGRATVDAEGNWSLQVETALLSGHNEFTAVEMDPAGNKTAPSGAYEVIVDSVPPPAPSIENVKDDVGPMQGMLQKNDLTDDARPTIIGTAQPGSTVKVYDGGKLLGQTVADASGKWSFTPETALADGTHNITATATNTVGQTSPETGVWSFVVDATPPGNATGLVVTDDVGNTKGPLTEGMTTDDDRPTFTGKAEPGATVSVHDNGKLLGTAPVDDNGDWTFTPPTPLPSGEHAFTTEVTDAAGNSSGKSDPLNVIVDAIPGEVAITALVDDQGAIKGAIAAGGITDDKRPEIQGTGKAGSTIHVYDGETLLGETEVQSNGTWKFTPTQDLVEGAHTLKVTATDKAGNVSDDKPTVSFTIDTLAPTAPTIDLVKDDVGALQDPLTNGGVTDDPTPTLSGKAEPGSTVTIKDGANVLGTAVAGANGDWIYTPTTPLAEGAHSFTVTATDKAGNVSQPSAPFVLTTDYTPPDASKLAITGVDDNVGETTGNIASGGHTDDSLPLISGTGTAGDTIIVRVKDVTTGTGEREIGRTTVNAEGKWTLQVDKPLLEGANGFTVIEVDPAGNATAPSTPYNVTVASVPPGVPVIQNIKDDVGVVHMLQKGEVTDDAKPTIIGTAQAGHTVRIYDGATLLGEVVAGADGKWAFTPKDNLADGVHNITATATNTLGATSVKTGIWNFQVDTQAPEKATGLQVLDNVGAVQDPLKNGDTTDDSQPEFKGKAEPGATVSVYDDGKLLGTALVDANGDWTFTPSTPLANGEHSFTTEVTDVAGNASGKSDPLNVFVDATPGVVVITALVDDQGDIKGAIAANGTTDDKRPEIQGTGKAGSTIHVYDGETLLGTTEVKADKTWSFTPTQDLAEGAHTLKVTATDKAGNVSDDKPTVSFTIDTLAPTAPTIDLVKDDVGALQDPLTNGGVTDDPSPTLSGKAEPGSTVKVYDGKTELGTAVIDDQGNWSFTPTTPLAEGAHSFTVTATDKAGNVSQPSAPFVLTTDYTPPDASKLAITGVDDNVGETTGNIASGGSTDDSLPLISGTGTAGDTIIVTVTDSTGTHKLGEATVGVGGTWSLQVTTPLLEGANGFTVIEVDPAGNATAPIAPYTVTLDSVPPGVPVIQNIKDDVGLVHMLQKGEVTDDAKPTIIGTAQAGHTVRIYDGATLLGEVVAGADGKWEFIPKDNLADGVHNITATATNTLGATSVKTGIWNFQVDTQAPEKATGLQVLDDVGAVQEPLKNGDTTDDSQPEFKGKAEPGATVNLYEGDTLLGSGVADKDGNWSITPDKLDDGAHSLTTEVVDPAGNSSGKTPALDFNVDTSKVTVSIDRLVDDQGHIKGTIAANGSTDDKRPEIQGTGKAGSTIHVYDGETLLGTTEVKADKTWSFTPTQDLVEGAHTLKVTATDKAGNVSDDKPTVSFTIDTVAPTAPTIDLVKDDVGALQDPLTNGGVTDDPSPTLSGKAEPGSTVTIKDGANVLGTAVAGANGDWIYTPTTPLAEGAHSFTVTATDKAGNVSLPSAPFVLTTDYTPPDASKLAITGVDDNVGETTGNIASGGRTDDSLPLISGTGTAGDTIIVTVTDSTGTHKLGEATVGVGGTWSLQVTTPLLEGANQFTVIEVDPAGNATAPSAPYTVTLDSVPPGVPVIQNIKDDVGEVHMLQKNEVTDDAKPTIIGTAQGGHTVRVYDGATLLGEVVAGADGKWAFTPTANLADGVHNITATATNTVGATSDPTGIWSFVVDTVPPGPVTDFVATDDVGGKKGALANGDITDDDKPTFSGKAEPGSTVKVYADSNLLGEAVAGANGQWEFTPSTALDDATYAFRTEVIDVAGNSSGMSAPLNVTVDTSKVTVSIDKVMDNVGTVQDAITPNGTTDDLRPEIHGKGKAGSTIKVYDGDVMLGSAVVAADGTWKFTPSADLSQGAHAITATATDTAGNTSEPTDAFNFTVDTVPPNTPTIDLVEDDVGAKQTPLTNGGVTDDPSPTLSGKAEPGSTVTIKDGANVLGTAVAGANGDWIYTPTTPLAEGAHSFTITATDKAGNVSVPSAPFVLTTDYTPPAASAATLSDNVGSITDPITSGDTTDDDTPTYAGTTEANATVVIYDGAKEIGSVQADAAGKWTFTPEPALTPGAHSFSHVVIDVAGNAGGKSAAIDFTVVREPLTIRIDEVADDVGPFTEAIAKGGFTDDTTPTLSGKATPGGTVTIYNGAAVLGTAVADAQGDWQFTPSQALVEGTYVLRATVTTVSGGESAKTDPFDFTVDISRPVKPVIESVKDDVGTVREPVANGGVTDDTTPTLWGKGEPNSLVQVYDNGTLLGTADVDSKGDWYFTPATPLGKGEHSFTVVNQDKAGNLSAPSDAHAITIDLDAPGKATIESVYDDQGAVTGNLTQGDISDDAKPLISGKAEPNSTVVIKDGTLELGRAPVDANGNWSFEPTLPLGVGPHNLTATAVDEAGNAGVPSDAFGFELIGPPAPAAPAITAVKDDVGTIRNDLQPNAFTDDARPTIVGTAEAGSTVTLFSNGQKLGTAVADASGNWTFTPSADLADGLHNITATATNAAGNPSVETGKYPINVDTLAPDPSAATLRDDVGSIKGPIATGDATDDTTPTYAGKTDANATVVIYDGGKEIARVQANATGDWTFTPTTPLEPGAHSFSNAVIDVAGNPGEKGEAIDFTVVVQPETISIDGASDNVGKITDPIAKGGVTDDATPTLTGKATPGGTVKVYDGNTLLGETLANATGDWEFTPSAALSEGLHNLTATVTTQTSLESAKTAIFDITVDRSAPSKPVIESVKDDVGDIQTAVANGGVTDDTTPTLHGKGEPNSTVHIYDAGTNLLGSVDVNAQGDWVFNPSPPLLNGEHSFTVVNEDKAGNLSAPSDPHVITVDTVPPAKPTLVTVADDVGTITTNVTEGGVTDDPKPEFQGKAEANSTVVVFDKGVEIGRVQADANGDWKLTPAAALADGTHSITVTAIDKAGNTSAPSDAFGFTVDTVPPAAPTLVTVVDDVGTITTNVTEGGMTDDAKPEFKGKAEANSTVVVFDKGVEIGRVQADANGDWKLTPAAALADGTHTITVTAIDKAGNTSVPTQAFGFTVDTVPPAAPTLVKVADDVGSITTDVTAGGITDDPRPDFSGKAEPNATVVIYDNGVEIARVPADAAGNWTYTPPTAMDNGAHSITLAAVDTAGNLGAPSAAFAFTVNTEPPLKPTIDKVMDDVGAKTGQFFSGDSTDDTKPLVTGNAEANSTVIVYDNNVEVARVQSNASGVWTYTPANALLDGGHSFSAVSVNKAGVSSSPSTAFGFTVDTVPPAAAPKITGAYDDVGTAIGNVASGGITDDRRPTLSGTGEIGAVVTVRSGSTVIGTATVGSDGKWSLVPSSDLALGNHSFIAMQADKAGNVSPNSSAYGLGVGTAAILMENFDAMGGIKFAQDVAVTAPSGLVITNVKAGKYPTYIGLPGVDGERDMLLGTGSTTRFDFVGGTTSLQYQNGAVHGSGNFARYYDASGALLGSEVFSISEKVTIRSFTAPSGKVVAYMTINAEGEGTTVPGGDEGFHIDDLSWSGVVVPKVNVFDAASSDAPEQPAFAVPEESTDLASPESVVHSDEALIAKFGFADRLEGGGGNDTFTNVGTADVVHGGAGDDTIRIHSGDFARIDGGLGIDTLVMDGKSMHIDLSALGAKVQGFEKFDLGAGGNTLALSASDVLAGGARDMVTADGKVQMLVNGANGDVSLLGGSDDWSQGSNATVGGVTYSVYTNLAGTAELLVEDKVHVTIL